MHGGADIVKRIRRAVLLRRAPLWLAGALPWCALGSIAGVIAWAAWCVWDGVRVWRRADREWTRWLDDGITALEDSSALLVSAASPLAQLQRERLLARLGHSIAPADLASVVRARVKPGYGRFAASAVLAALAWWWTAIGSGATGGVQQAAVAPKAVAGQQDLRMRVAPPKYTGVALFESAPRDTQMPEFSEVAWCVKEGQPFDAPIELSNGQLLAPDAGCARWIATESVFWRWHGVRYNLRVTPDEAPQITVTAPAQMVHELRPGADSASIAVSVRDDYRVQRATLHLTLARGSGENIRFTDREMPLPESLDPKMRAWSKQWALAELGMEPGDELYFFVRATDNAQHPHTVQSPTYTVRLPAPQEAAETESTALPTLVKPESLRSQRQIIIDTEQLVADMKAAKVNAAAVRDRSETIASDQAALRRRYGQFLGEESTLFGGDDHDDDHGGEKKDILHEFGHAHDEAENATLYDEATKKVLRRALSAMWDAEKALRAITPKMALPPEYKALEAIKELQQAERIYLHKTAFVPPAIKEDKRMTGDVVGAASYRREQDGASEQAPRTLRELIFALGMDGPLPALWTRTAHDWVREHIPGDEQRLAAQRAIQDVADGCTGCRASLRAWLRAGVAQAPVLLQAKPVADTPFTKGWREGADK